MDSKKILWLEDQISDLETYKSTLFRKGYLIDVVSNISEVVKMLSNNSYSAIILDIRVPPGFNSDWQGIDKEKLKRAPNQDSHLGMEFLRSIFTPEETRIKFEYTFDINPCNIIVMSGIEEYYDELITMGIPPDQLISKSNSNINTLLQLIEKMNNTAK